MASKPPASAGRIVAVTEFQGALFVACEFAVFRLIAGEFEQMLFVEAENGLVGDYDAAVSHQEETAKKPPPFKIV